MLKYSLNIICLPCSHLAPQGFQTIPQFLNPLPMWFICPSGTSVFLSNKDKTERKIRAYICLVKYSVFQVDWKGKSVREKVTWKMGTFHGMSSWCLEIITSRTAQRWHQDQELLTDLPSMNRSTPLSNPSVLLAFTISCSNELFNYMVCATVLQSLLTRWD